MAPNPQQFTALSRVLHWLTAAAVLTMFALGAAMLGSLQGYHALVAVHRPLGIAVLVLTAVRIVNRILNPPPPLPATVARPERLAAAAAEYTMYALLVALPLVGWGMLSAAHYPVVLWGPVHLPEILPHSAPLFAALRRAHTVLAALFLLVVLAHLTAVLYHSLVAGDGFWKRMAPWPVRPLAVAPAATPAPSKQESER